MAKITTLLLIAFMSCINYVSAFEAFLAVNRFYAPKIGAYIETDILIPASGLKFIQNSKQKFIAQIEITLLVKRNNQIVTFDKYILNSLEFNDGKFVSTSLIDKKRFVLESGVYTLEAYFTDINSTETKSIQETFILDENQEDLFISDISFIDHYAKSEENNLYTKNGFHLTPYVLNFFSENINKLIFYAEIYNLNHILIENAEAELSYSIKKYKSDLPLNSTFSNKIPLKPHNVNILFAEFNIESLPTGNYELVVEIRKKNTELLAIKKVFFQRSKTVALAALSTENYQSLSIENTFVNNFTLQELSFQMRALLADASSNEAITIKTLLNQKDEQLMKQYFYNYWNNKNPLNPEAEWKAYNNLIITVNDMFATCLGRGSYGFETDRGRVYMKYGKPNQRNQRIFDSEHYPHEIWHYYQTKDGKQNNVKFVFLNRELACDNYKLVHSNALGEILNNQWPNLIRKGPSNNSPDDYFEMNQANPYDNNVGNRINTMYKE